MASAQVRLGLTPTLLAVLGPSTEETSVLFVAGRRPFLALCLSAGSPAVSPMRSFDGSDPVGILKERRARLQPPHFEGFREATVVALQYVLTIIAIVNIATLSKELGVFVVCNFAPHFTDLVLLWVFLILISHTLGSIALIFRVRSICQRESGGAYERIKGQFTPLSTHGTISVQLIPEGYLFTFLS